MNDYFNDLFLYLCVIPSIIFVILSIFMAYYMLRFLRWMTPNEKRLIAQFVSLRQRRPKASTRQLVGTIVQRQAIRSGLIGAVTGLGGFVVLPFGLSFDFFTTTRTHTATLHLIAFAYELENPGEVPKVLDMNEVLGLKKGGALRIDLNAQTQQFVLMRSNHFTAYATQETILMMGEKAFAKFIPFFGFFTGFIVNYLMTRGLMLAAVEWYSGNVNRYGDQLKAAREQIGGASVSPALLEAGAKLAGQAGLIRRALGTGNPVE